MEGNHIGEKIKELRNKKGYSLRELGYRLNMNHSYLSRIENGKQKPHIDLLRSIAGALDANLADFFIDESKSEFTENEKGLISENILTPSSLKEKYVFEIDGKPATEEEIENMITYIKFLRSQKN